MEKVGAKVGEEAPRRLGVRLLTAAEAAERLKVKPQSLRIRRMRGGGPPFLRLSASPSARVYYEEQELEQWIAERPRYSGTGEEKASRAVEKAPPRKAP